MKKRLLFLLLFSISTVAFAQTTPAGLWKTIDDSTKKERSLVRISESAGVYTGVIEKSLDPNDKPGALCEKCTDERKYKPLIGTALIRNVKQSDQGVWGGGDILDPDIGKVYRVRLKLIEDGKKLEVRGYIGTPLLGRTQTWIRVE